MPRPTGTGATSIRIEAGDEQHRPRLFIGRALWQALGSPARLTIGTPLFDALQLTDGDYPAEIADGAIIARVT